MTIKAKLIANMLVTAVIVAGITLASFSSMRFLQDKLSDIAEKSTPYQIATVEFQRTLQRCISDLITVTNARTMQEYTTYRAEAIRSQETVKEFQQTLHTLNSGNRVNVAEEIDAISDELFSAVEARITSDSDAQKINTKVLQQLNESSFRLNELDMRIRKLQANYAESFASILKNNEEISEQLRNLEILRDLVNNLLFAAQTAHNARNVSSFRIASGKINTILYRIAEKNTDSSALSSDLRGLDEDTREFLRLQEADFSGSTFDSKRWAAESLKSLTESMNTITLVLDQNLELNSSKLTIETNRQGTIFTKSNDANSILITNSELVALGLSISGEINKLFSSRSPAELHNLHSAIRPLFAKLTDRAMRVENSLIKLGAKDEVRMLHAAIISLDTIKQELQSANGIVATLEKSLRAIETANDSSGRLRKLVIKQSAMGNERVSVAQGAQKKSIIAVNDMLRRSVPRIAGIGALAVLFGVLFSYWIYRAVLTPLRVALAAVRTQQVQAVEKAKLAEAIAEGDLNQEVPISEPLSLDEKHLSNDEMGKLLNAVADMSDAQTSFDNAFAQMTSSLRTSRNEEERRNRMKNALFELNLILRNEQDGTILADRTLAFIAGYTGAKTGIMYKFETSQATLYPVATYALAGTPKKRAVIKPGEGLAGQAVLERKRIILDSVPPDYLTVTSALGGAEPRTISVFPILYNDVIYGVLELGSFQPFSGDDLEFVNQSLEGIAIALNINHSRMLVNTLLEQAQQQAEELRQTNEELEERSQMFSERRSRQRTPVAPA